MMKREAHSFQEARFSPKNRAELKKPTTGINKVKGTTADVEYVFIRKPHRL